MLVFCFNLHLLLAPTFGEWGDIRETTSAPDTKILWCYFNHVCRQSTTFNLRIEP
jgi:hypothetical protein